MLTAMQEFLISSTILYVTVMTCLLFFNYGLDDTLGSEQAIVLTFIWPVTLAMFVAGLIKNYIVSARQEKTEKYKVTLTRLRRYLRAVYIDASESK